MSAPNVIQLREMLSEKFPGARLRLPEAAAGARRIWPTGCKPVDDLLGGGLPKGALTEITSAARSSGSASLLRLMLRQAAGERQIAAVVDGADSLDVTGMEEAVLSRLLWVRCRNVSEALQAADLLLRDNNVSLIFLDLAGNTAAQLRRVQATTWYRFQRLIEEAGTVCAVLTPRPMVAAAQTRIILNSKLSLDHLDWRLEELPVQAEATESHSAREQASSA